MANVGLDKSQPPLDGLGTVHHGTVKIIWSCRYGTPLISSLRICVISPRDTLLVQARLEYLLYIYGGGSL